MTEQPFRFVSALCLKCLGGCSEDCDCDHHKAPWIPGPEDLAEE